VQRVGVRRDDDHLAETLHRGEPVGALGQTCEPLREGVVPAAVAVQQIHDGKAASLVGGVAWRQVDGDLAVQRIRLQVPFERFPVHRGAFDGPALPDCRRAARSPGCARSPLCADEGCRGKPENDDQGGRTLRCRGRWMKLAHCTSAPLNRERRT
jgi:hypothetical protein